VAHVSSTLQRVGGFVALTKPRIIELLLVTTVPVMFVASRDLPSATRVLCTVAGGTLSAGGANAANMVYDRDIDAVMHRTQRRPLVQGTVKPVEAGIFAAALELGAFVLLWRTTNLLAAVLALGAAAFYVGVYTMWLKRRFSSNIVIGGAAGAAPVLVGWAAVTGRLTWAPVLIFLVVFAWTPPHFWALAIRYRDDYQRATVPMLPSVASLPDVCRKILVYSVLMVGVTIAVGPVAHLGWGYLGPAIGLGAAFIVAAWQVGRDPTPRKAMRLFGFSISYLTILFVVMGLVAIVEHP
jgi:heme o synthase